MTQTNGDPREGRPIQNFELPDQELLPFDLYQALKEKPLVLVFYRGDWWPYCNGQLVSYARSYEEFVKRGFGLVGISVDPPSRNLAMVGKLGLPFPLLSDPKGEVIKDLGLWNEEEGVSEPTIVVLDRSGTVRRLYSGGTDFSDRPTEEVLFGLLDEVGTEGEPDRDEPEIRVTPEEAEKETVRPQKPALALDELGPYYLGSHYAAVAMEKKLEDEAKEKVEGYRELVDEYGAAIRKTGE